MSLAKEAAERVSPSLRRKVEGFFERDPELAKKSKEEVGADPKMSVAEYLRRRRELAEKNNLPKAKQVLEQLSPHLAR